MIFPTSRWFVRTSSHGMRITSFSRIAFWPIAPPENSERW